MPYPIQDSAEIVISCSQGNKVLRRIKQMTPDDEAETEFQTFVGNNGRPGGYTDKPGGITLTLTETPEIPEEIDWAKLKRNREYFAITVQYKGGSKLGKREQYVDCRVSKVSPASANADGESEREIQIKSLDLRAL